MFEDLTTAIAIIDTRTDLERLADRAALADEKIRLLLKTIEQLKRQRDEARTREEALRAGLDAFMQRLAGN